MVSKYLIYTLIPLFSSPLLAFLYTKSYRPGKLRVESSFLKGRLDELKIMGDVVLARNGRKGYAGFTYIDLGEDFFNFREKTPDYFFMRANVLGRLLSGLSVEAELRLTRVSVDTRSLRERLVKELSALRAVIESVGDDEVLRERERILKKIYMRVSDGESINGLRVYLVLRTVGNDAKEVVRRLREEASEASRAFSIILGLTPRILKGRELRSVMEGRLMVSPISEPVLGGETEISASIPIPPYEQGTLDSRGVFLGYRRKTRIPYFYNILRYGSRHILVVGPTGKGKTTLLATIANRLFSRNQTDMVLLDPKGDLARLLSKGFERLRFCPSTIISCVGKGFFRSMGDTVSPPSFTWQGFSLENTPTNMAELEDLLGVRLFFVRKECPGKPVDLDNLLKYRRAVIVMDNLTDTGRFVATAMILYCMLEKMYEMPPSQTLRRLVVIDESWRSGEASLYYTRRLIKESRGFGIGLLFSTQTLKDIPTDILHNFGTSIVFGSPEAGYIEGVCRLTGIGKAEAMKTIPVLGIGEAMIKLPDTSVPAFVNIDAETGSSSGHL